ncbi:hypothetical protein [Blastococcus brunescens]|uniref:Uncharacterized protein n=1 Tax=Blastococcus brunescens TaxID=1564165 RepID=A0ABZ1AVB3_9ACTN|nr:hypothetical protein [Blastococcus sp. BMG 8361]WRL62450.1 hypothetical protein U6N30_20850 [Blastococcus sp. BMG 8361]
METMHAAGRRTLPPVPRTTAEPIPAPPHGPVAEEESDTPTERFVVDLTTGEQRTVGADELTEGTTGGATGTPAPAPAGTDDGAPERRRPEVPGPRELDLAQQFVARLRAAAADFAEAAGAESAVVREAVPPARHRRARCRLVLRYADEAEVDVTFLGSAGLPGSPTRHGFDRQIRRWLKAGQRREDAWLVTDPDAPDGIAVDLSAWLAAA